jgi:hypothetical protein
LENTCFNEKVHCDHRFTFGCAWAFTGAAFNKAGNAIANTAEAAYNATVQAAMTGIDRTRREINTLEGVYQVIDPLVSFECAQCIYTCVYKHAETLYLFPGLQNVSRDANKTLIDFKESAIKEYRSVSSIVVSAADSMANATVRVVSEGVSGVVTFGNTTWRELMGSPAAAAAAAVAPASEQVRATA